MKKLIVINKDGGNTIFIPSTVKGMKKEKFMKKFSPSLAFPETVFNQCQESNKK